MREAAPLVRQRRFLIRRVVWPATVVHMAGLGIMAVSGGMLVSAGVAVVAGDGGGDSLAIGGVSGVLLGATIWRLTGISGDVRTTTALAAVAWTWLAASLWGSLPFLLEGTFAHPDDAIFESVSGFTGTGSTVLSPIEGNPKGILFWRSMTQWFGGMGMVVLAVAVLPFLGVGGMELIRSEAPGPTADRLAHRVSETAKRLWLVYLGFTALATAVLVVIGMDLFDGVVHAFTTVSTGGFSPYDASIGHFDSMVLEAALVILMLAGATNFTLHWRVVTRGEVGGYVRSGEWRFYVGLFGLTAAGVFLLNLFPGGMGGLDAVRKSTFTVASMVSSTGFAVDDFSAWVPAAQLVILFLMMSGGMAGSTSGGMKALRVHALLRQAFREARRVRHPRAVLPLRLADQSVSQVVVERIAGFVLLYVLIGVISVLVVTGLGADVVSAVGGVATSMGNGGPGLGHAGTEFGQFSRPTRGYLALLMLIGRLEIFAILIGLGILLRRPWMALNHPVRAHA